VKVRSVQSCPEDVLLLPDKYW